MPCCTGYERDPHRWRQCLAQASKAMIAAGWWVKAGKFNEVRRRKAVKLYNHVR